ncbi:lipocalin family protein [Dasania marina]|uniref:lipocalin family protein n=1 Tax=Dasania marina TaxID=471499 RepID=UPI000363331A|nr:lipocalin family protein [Dasania marina]
MRYLLFTAALTLLSGCIGIPEGITPVNNFDINRYTGKWYEIARLDHSFERNMQSVSAEYSVHSDGGITVINRGLKKENNQWKTAEGKAYFVRDNSTAHLKVSFFGPFYGSYIVFELDEEYQHAFITSTNRSYLWLLSRSPTISLDLKNHFIDKITRLGFEAKNIIFVNQDMNNMKVENNE